VQSEDVCARAGTWYYDHVVPCRVEIWQRSVRPGTGDHQDPPDIAGDLTGKWYEVQYSHPDGTSGHVGGAYYETLDAAMESVHVHTQASVRWDPSCMRSEIDTKRQLFRVVGGLIPFLTLVGINVFLCWQFYHGQTLFDGGVRLGFPYALWQTELFVGGDTVIVSGMLADLGIAILLGCVGVAIANWIFNRSKQ
jgi:hypothetical protein